MIKTYFFDTSIILKLLLSEENSDEARKIVNDPNCWVCTSWILIAEALSVLKRKWLRKKLSKKEYDSKIYFLFSLMEEGRVKPIDVEGKKLAAYGNVIVGLGRKYGDLDIADLLQLSAISNNRFLKGLAAESRPILVTSDRRLNGAARQEGISTQFLP